MMNQPIWTYLPFGIVLLLIAVMPLAFPRFWSGNKNKAIICITIALPVFIFTLVHFPDRLMQSIEEYICFILMLSAFSLSPGESWWRETLRPPRNLTIFLFIGAVVSNLIGTTGASMLLIRPLLQTISERRHIFHIPVFFIFVVSNIGEVLPLLAIRRCFWATFAGSPSPGPSACCRTGSLLSACCSPPSTFGTGTITGKRQKKISRGIPGSAYNYRSMGRSTSFS